MLVAVSYRGNGGGREGSGLAWMPGHARPAAAAAAAAAALAVATALVLIGPPTAAASALEEKCSDGQFKCGDGGRCIPREWRCDGRVHCADATDELDCIWNTTCGAGQFRCARSGRCIAASWRCDGDADCGPDDGSDEEPYMCEEGFQCRGNWARCATPVDGHFSCVPVIQFCDGARHCLDGSDEWDLCRNCTSHRGLATVQCCPLSADEKAEKA